MSAVEWIVMVIADDGTEQHVLSTTSRSDAADLARSIGEAGTNVRVVEQTASQVPSTSE
jgi:hypothetical protein